MKHGQGLCFLRAQSPRQLTGCQEPKSLAHAEEHPHFIVLCQGACQSHCENDNISVNSADDDLVVASVSCMQHHAGVRFFVVAWGQTCDIRERWLAQDSISIRDDQLLLCKLEGVVKGARQKTEQLRLIVIDSEEAGPVAGGLMHHPPRVF